MKCIFPTFKSHLEKHLMLVFTTAVGGVMRPAFFARALPHRRTLAHSLHFSNFQYNFRIFLTFYPWIDRMIYLGSRKLCGSQFPHVYSSTYFSAISRTVAHFPCKTKWKISLGARHSEKNQVDNLPFTRILDMKNQFLRWANFWANSCAILLHTERDFLGIENSRFAHSCTFLHGQISLATTSAKCPGRERGRNTASRKVRTENFIERWGQLRGRGRMSHLAIVGNCAGE